MNADARTPVAKREFWLLFAVLAVAFALRVFAFGAAGVDHFDEGVYAFSGLGLSDGDQPHTWFPDQVLFSPPLYCALVALGNLVTGASDHSAVLLNVLLGTATVGLVWAFARRSFGPAAALAAATLLAFNEYHVGLCRTGLTDVSFAFFFVLAVLALTRALERRSFGLAVLAGCAVGLAWNTKYHGWFAGLVATAALAAWIVRGRAKGVGWGREVAVLAVAGVVAALCYLPWALHVESEITYAALTRYQRTMLRADYLGNLVTQIGNQAFLDGPFTRASAPLAIAAALLVRPPAIRGWSGVVLGAALLAVLFGGTAFLLVAALLAVPLLLRRPATLAEWTVLGWTGLFFFSAPLYFPYARLLLPLVVAMTLLAGWSVARIVQADPAADGPPWPAPTAVLVGGLTLVLGFLAPPPGNPWRPSRAADEAAGRIAELVPAGARCVVLGEPTVAYYLHVRGRPSFERVRHPDRTLAETAETVYVVQGIYGRKAPELRDGLAALADRLTEIATVPLGLPKDHRLLDDLGPAGAQAFLDHPDDRYALRVYRLRPAGPGPR